MYNKKKSLPLKIIKSNGAVPRLKKHLLKTEVIAGLVGQMKKGDRVEGSQRRGSIVIFKQFTNTSSIVKQMSTLLRFQITPQRSIKEAFLF